MGGQRCGVIDGMGGRGRRDEGSSRFVCWRLECNKWRRKTETERERSGEGRGNGKDVERNNAEW